MGEEPRIMKTNYHLEPTVFAIFGGMGDITWRKLAPALFDLSRDRSLPTDFSIIAVDRVKLNEEKPRRRLHDGVRKFSRRGSVKTGEWAKFASHIHYRQGDFKKLQTYRDENEATLIMRADQVEAAWQLLMPELEVWAVALPSDFPNLCRRRLGTGGHPRASRAGTQLAAACRTEGAAP